MSVSAARPSIVDKPLPSGKGEVSASAFAFLFSELVQYSLHRVKRTADLETRLESAGHSIGLRVLELLVHREKANRKETNLIAMLQFVTTTVWRALFGKVADGLEKSNNSEDECACLKVLCSQISTPIHLTYLIASPTFAHLSARSHRLH